MNNKNQEVTFVVVSLTLILLLPASFVVQGDYLTIGTSTTTTTTNLLLWITENGTVINIGSIYPAISLPNTISSQYFFNGKLYYALHDYNYLFSFNPASFSNFSVLLQVPQGGQLMTMCVSQQFGTVYAILVGGAMASVVRLDNSGGVNSAAHAYAIATNASIQQCIVDDDFSRIIWTYKTVTTQLTTNYMMATDLLPQADGNTILLFNDTNVPVWLFFDWFNELFYATTISQGAPQLFQLSIALNGVKKTLITKGGANMTTAQGSLNTDTGIISLFSGGFMEQVNIANQSWSHVTINWGTIGQLGLNPMSVAWAPQYN